MRTKLLLAISPTCLALYSQCTNAAPVYDFHPSSLHNVNHLDASHIGANYHPLISDGRLQSSDFKRRPRDWVHLELAEMFKEAGLPSSSKHEGSTKAKKAFQPHLAEEHHDPSHGHDNGLWAVVGESSRKFGKIGIIEGSGFTEGSQFKPMKGVVQTSNDPLNWRYKLDPEVISAVHKKYRSLVNDHREYGTLNKHLMKVATQQDALALLSQDPDVVQAAFQRIGVPRIRKGRASDGIQGDRKKKVVERLHLATGLPRQVIAHDLDKVDNVELARKLKSSRKGIFDKGAQDYINERVEKLADKKQRL
jgi:hypothetical protein